MEGIENSNSLTSFLSQGADERIFLNEQGLTKYGIPLIDNGIINRGSCTCNPTTFEDAKEMEKLLNRFKSEQEWIDLQENISNGLKSKLNPSNTKSFEVFFAPSGTDLLYLPILFARVLNPNKKILNVVTCIEELGSGTKMTASEKYYANTNQFGDPLTKGSSILKDNSIKTIFLNARSEDGVILNNKEKIESILKEHPDYLIIINLVYGSKSGIEDNLGLIDSIKADNIIWNTDICQFRHSNEIINMLIRKKVTVMITGSKFYQSPPFSGAMLVPENIYTRLCKIDDWDAVKNYGTVFSAYDFPKDLQTKLNYFPKQINYAGILRWYSGINELKKYQSLSKQMIVEKINIWRKLIFEEMNKRDFFELMPQQQGTNNTIISFRLKVNGMYMNHEDLKQIHSNIVHTNYENTHSFKHVFIGQPVAYTNRSFLRLAIGAKNIRAFIENDEKLFTDDLAILDIIENKLKSFYEDNYSNR